MGQFGATFGQAEKTEEHANVKKSSLCDPRPVFCFVSRYYPGLDALEEARRVRYLFVLQGHHQHSRG